MITPSAKAPNTHGRSKVSSERDGVVRMPYPAIRPGLHHRSVGQRDDAVRPVSAERADHPVARDLQQQDTAASSGQMTGALRRDQEEDRRDPGEMDDGDDRIVARARPRPRLRRSARACSAANAVPPARAAPAPEVRRSAPAHRFGEHVPRTQSVRRSRFDAVGRSAERFRVAPCGDSTGTKTRREARCATGRP